MTEPSTLSEKSSGEKCNHRGWALWRSRFAWWCGNCGISIAIPALLYGAPTVKAGDLVLFK